MISVVSRDARKRLPLDCSVEEEMDETELEEGEAFSSREDDNSSIDPDALSYIDEKLQSVLGHFQKDFEGGVVSAENLGTKYGGYGSFLPTYQRSPPGAQNSGTNESINVKHIEKTPSQSNFVKEDIVGMPSSRLELVSHSANSSDQKSLRVRIKVGSETVKKNSELYSGLGLDVSPTSSLNDSPNDSEGLSHELEDGPDVSPTSILQIMTSLPLLDGIVLSPLTDHLICLTEKEKFLIESARRLSHKGVKESSNGCHSGLKIKRDKSSENVIRGPFAKEADIDIMDCEELVANTLKLPLLSSSQSRSVDYAKCNMKLDHNSKLADLVKENDRSVSFSKASAQTQNGSKSLTEGVMGSVNRKAIKEASSHEECDMEMTAVKEQTSSVGKKKPKSKHNVQDSKVTKDSNNANGHLSKTKIGESRLHNHHQEGKDKYSDFFGDMELGQEDNNDVDSVGTPSPLEPIKSELVGKNTLNGHASKEMMNVEKREKTPKLEAPSKGPIGDASHGSLVPPLVKEYWVGCDKCQKWRLLPLGIYPKSLPEKWLCSMLDWLPGMNRCSVSEEETTKAVTAQNLLPPSNGQMIQSGQSDVVMSDPYSRNAGQSHENRGFPSMPCVGKKKSAVKEMTNSMDVSSIEQSLKKNIKASTHSRSLNEVGQILPAADDLRPHKNKHKEKNKQLDYRSEGGDTRSSKIKYKGGPGHSDQDEDLSSGAKRTKRDNNVHHMDEKLHDQGGSVEKVRPSSSSGLSVNASGKVEQRSKEHLKVNKSEGNNNSNYDAKDVTKRKLKEDCRGTIEETNENNHKIGKKAKVSMSGWKEGSPSKSSGGTTKRGTNAEDRLLGPDLGSSVSRQRVDAIEPLAKEMGSHQPSVAAASSSSKVSGSPVESVSSSPLRISNHDKAKLTRRDPEPKEDYRRSSDSQDEGRRERAFDALGKNGENSGVSRARVIEAPSQLENRRSEDGCNGSSRLNTPPTKLPTIDRHCNDDGKRNENEGYLDTSHARKSGKGSLSRSKDNDGGLKDKLSNFSKESVDNSFPCEGIARSGKSRVLDKIDPVDKVANEKAKSQIQLKLNVKVDAVSSSQEQKKNQRFDDDDEKSSRKSTCGKTDQIESSGKEKSNLLPPSGRSQNEGLKLANGTSEGYSSVKHAKNVKSLENDQPTKPRNRVVDAPSPLRRDSFSQAASTAIREATNLKHTADRVQNSGVSGESTSLYFEAALKFLHGASLMELSSTETSKQTVLTYSSTAKLCAFCAHEYEKSKDMAHAALAYKCMEVAYLRVVYSSHNTASRDRHELQTALHIVPGESPSSSNSDVDNLNHPAAADKSLLTKGVSSPQIAGQHVITAKSLPSFQRILGFAQNVHNAMEASRKLRAAFAAAKSRSEGHHRESLSSVKRALDFNFNDVEGLLRLIRLAMDAMSR